MSRINRIIQIFKKVKKRGIIRSILFVLVSLCYHVTKPLYLFYFYHFSKLDEKQVLFTSFPNFSGNSLALYKYLLNNFKDLHFIWLFNESGNLQLNTENTNFIRMRNSIQYHHGVTFASLKQIVTAKYLFFTHGSPIKYVNQRPGQIVINLWHGCGYKAVEKREKSWISENPFDYALVPGKLFIETKKEFWGCREDQILPIGYPQYDFMLTESEQGEAYINKIKGKSEKLIIWMPTFRNTEGGKYPEEKVKASYDIPLMNSLEDMFMLDQLLQDLQVTLCIKRHTYQLRYSCEGQDFQNIKFISNEDLAEAGVELYSILHYTDALISDYSSVAFDYLLLDKPIAFCLDDFEDYKNTRGFVFENPLEYMPGHHLYKFDDLKGFIEDFCAGIDDYREQRAKVRAVAQNPCNNYCKRVWDTVQQLKS